MNLNREQRLSLKNNFASGRIEREGAGANETTQRLRDEAIRDPKPHR